MQVTQQWVEKSKKKDGFKFQGCQQGLKYFMSIFKCIMRSWGNMNVQCSAVLKEFLIVRGDNSSHLCRSFDCLNHASTRHPYIYLLSHTFPPVMLFSLISLVNAIVHGIINYLGSPGFLLLCGSPVEYVSLILYFFQLFPDNDNTSVKGECY